MKNILPATRRIPIKSLLVLSVLILIAALMAFSGGDTGVHNTGGSPAGFCGDPASTSATCRSCHSGPNLAPITGVFTSNIPPAGYIPATSYTITANFIRPGHSKFGFEASPQNASGTLLGTMGTVNANTQVIGSGKYITHTSSGTAGSGGKTWNFLWTAPAPGTGPVTFYGAFNATNSNNMSTGDSIFRTTFVVTENISSVQNFHENIYSFRTFPNPVTDYLTVKFTLQESSSVAIELLDINGNHIRNLFAETEMKGEVNQLFDISSCAKGIYFIRLSTDGIPTLHKVLKI